MQRSLNDVLTRLEQYMTQLQPSITMQRADTELKIKLAGTTHIIQRTQANRNTGSVRLR